MSYLHNQIFTQIKHDENSLLHQINTENLQKILRENVSGKNAGKDFDLLRTDDNLWNVVVVAAAIWWRNIALFIAHILQRKKLCCYIDIKTDK